MKDDFNLEFFADKRIEQILGSDDLDAIGLNYGTDKVSQKNGYTRHYEHFFEPIRYKKLKILEIGVYKGASLFMWQKYFPNSHIYGIDNGKICDNAAMNSINACEPRITTYRADQVSREDLAEFIKDCGGDFDIIIDDGYHFQEHQQVSLGFLYPYLKDGGIYIVEDIVLPSKKFEDDSWGIKDCDHFSDTTFNIITSFMADGYIESPYMTKEEANQDDETDI